MKRGFLQSLSQQRTAPKAENDIVLQSDHQLPPGSVTISFFCEQSERGTHCLIDRVMEITCGLSPLPLLTKHGLP